MQFSCSSINQASSICHKEVKAHGTKSEISYGSVINKTASVV
jgi:hypothetical protein